MRRSPLWATAVLVLLVAYSSDRNAKLHSSSGSSPLPLNHEPVGFCNQTASASLVACARGREDLTWSQCCAHTKGLICQKGSLCGGLKAVGETGKLNYSKETSSSKHVPSDEHTSESPSIQKSSEEAAASLGQRPETRKAAGTNKQTLDPVPGRWILRFRKYRRAAEHKQSLIAALGSKGWHWIERNNPAARYPTDFAVLSIRGSPEGAKLRSRLAALEFVKDIHPEMQWNGGLMWEDQEADSKPCSQADTGRSVLMPKAGQEGASDVAAISKPPGRLQTRTSVEVEPDLGGARLHGCRGDGCKVPLLPYNVSLLDGPLGGRALLAATHSQITSMFQAEQLWAKGYSGKGVRMAVFDTGVRQDHPHFRKIKERTNWTNENTLDDSLGHGTFVAGVIASQDAACLGFAPDAEIYAFRVFTNAQVSYTSWFLDAFNYAIASEMNVLNLSIGGPDYLDQPFVEKVWELTANNVIMVSAIGNDGPLYGTLNNPADQMDVIGVGGIDYNDAMAGFSSRGMSTWELPHGYGRIKPDIVAYGRDVIGSKISGGCKSLSGTSVASPVVAGAVCLLASVVPEEKRWQILNPGSMKQALVEGATRLQGPNMVEQGIGRLNLVASQSILESYQPRASVSPSKLDLTECPYAWPFCRQPLYHGAMPLLFNATILNGMGVVGYLEGGPKWEPENEGGRFLKLDFTYSDVIWPWSGFLGLYIRVLPEGSKFSGVAEGTITFFVRSPPAKGETENRLSSISLPLTVAIIPTPTRDKRVLWDQFHSVRYPPGYIPRDSLDVRNDILDWHGDHPHTNFHGLYDALRDAGYYLEVLGSPFVCFDADHYGTLLLVDPEEEYFPEEIEKLRKDVQEKGMGLLVFADWYQVDAMVKMKFFDDNTRSWWTPVTGGANVPALNDLLEPFGIAFGDSILAGYFSLGPERTHYASGAEIAVFPVNGTVHKAALTVQSDPGGALTIQSQGQHGVASAASLVQPVLTPNATIADISKKQQEHPQGRRLSQGGSQESAILGLMSSGKGNVAVFGDSNCLDSSHQVLSCYWLLKKLLAFTSSHVRDPLLFSADSELSEPLGSASTVLPLRRTDVNFTDYSGVLGKPLMCGLDAPLELQGGPRWGEDFLKASLAEPQVQTAKQEVVSEQEPKKEVEEEIAQEKVQIGTGVTSIEKAPGEGGGQTGGPVNKREGDEKMEMFSRQYHNFITLGIGFVGFLLIMLLWRCRQRRRLFGQRLPKKNSHGQLPI